MVIINGIEFNDIYSWINGEIPIDRKIADGIIFLVPIYNAGNRLGIWMKMVERLNPCPEEVIFCENDSVDNTVDLINKWNYPHKLIQIVTKDMKLEGRFETIAMVRQTLFMEARKLNSKYAIFVDDDIIPSDPNVIEQIISNNKDIVGGVYIKKVNGVIPCIVAFWDVNAPQETMPQINNLKGAIESCKKNNYPYILFRGCEHQLYEVSVIGAGFICLSNKIVSDENMRFYPIVGAGGEDAAFCRWAKALGYKIFLDGKIRCSHMIFEKDRLWNVK